MAVTATYGQGITPANLTYDVNEAYAMVEKIARQVIRNVVTEDHLAVFDKLPVDKGTTIEEAIIKLVEAQPSADGSTVCAPISTEGLIAVKYYKNWTKAQFKTRVSIDEIRKVMDTDGNVEAIAERIAGTLVESDKQDKYEKVKGLFKYGVGSTNPVVAATFVDINKGTPIDCSTDGGYKKLLKTIKNTVSGMKFVNADFNTGGIKRMTLASDIYIVMPYKIKNAIDVDELAGVFNLSKAEIEGRIIEIDEGDNIYIVDQNAILDYTRLYELTSFWNGEGLYTNYWLTTERLYALSPLFDGCYISVTKY